MAKNKGRAGEIKKRSQFLNPITRLWQKRSRKSGRIMDVKTSSKRPFKGVRKEH